MNTEYLKNISDINIDVLPKIIKEEYEKIRLKFNIDTMGVYYSQYFFSNYKILNIYCLNTNETNRRIKFNNNLDLAKNHYVDGFIAGYFDQNIFVGIENKEDQIFEIFQGIYKKFDKIQKSSILEFKKNITHYSDVFFIENQFYEYGFTVGKFINYWTIILNNVNHFESIFTKYFEITKTKEEDKMYFKVGLLFARKKIFSKIVTVNDIKTTKYYYDNEIFDNPHQLSKHLELTRQYINDSFTGANTNHNIFNNIKQLKNIIDYCHENAITIDESFLTKYSTLIEKRQ
jgi:hypothetical protein